MTHARYLLAAVVTALVFSTSVRAEESPDKERADLRKAVSAAIVSLEKGLAASATEGKPISAKFEIEDGKLQLSAYTVKGGKFYEVVVDHQTGKVSKTEPIDEDEDLAAAKSQNEAMAKAKLSLHDAVGKALAEHKGFLAVSVDAQIKDGHPVAEVSLIRGEAPETATVKLD